MARLGGGLHCQFLFLRGVRKALLERFSFASEKALSAIVDRCCWSSFMPLVRLLLDCITEADYTQGKCEQCSTDGYGEPGEAKSVVAGVHDINGCGHAENNMMERQVLQQGSDVSRRL